MAGGPLLPSSTYVGGASGNLSPQFYIGTTASGTNAQAGFSAFEGVAVVATLAAQAQAIYQFNLPEVIPPGTMKLRLLAQAAATAGIAYWKTKDAQTAPGGQIGASTFSIEADSSITWSGAAGTTTDDLIENKQTLTTVPTANYILTVVVTFALQGVATTAFTLAQQSVWQASIVWE